MIAIRRVIERPGFVNDANGRFLGGEDDLLNLIEPRTDLWMQFDGSLDRGLGVELRWKGDFEQNVLHHIGAKSPRYFERLTTKEHIREAPGFGRKRRRITHFTAQRHQRVLDRAPRRIACRPRLA